MGHEGHRVDGQRARRHRAHDRHGGRRHRERLSRPRAPTIERQTMSRLLAVLAGCALALNAAAQAYPTKPIKLVVGYPPGGSGDFTTRMAADELTKELGVAIVVENKPGAGGNIAHDFVAHSAPDGYTVLNAGHMALNRALYRNLSYDPDKDFIPVTRLATGPTVICVNNDVPVKDLRELIAYAKANPGKLFNAAAGYAS